MLPVILGLLGAAVDLARVYQVWVTLQSATRNAAEYAATNDTTVSAASTDARRVACIETANVPGFVAGATAATCTSPQVSVTSFTINYAAAGTSAGGPIATVTVHASLGFHTLFPYPFVTHNGVWTLAVTETYAVAQVQ